MLLLRPYIVYSTESGLDRRDRFTRVTGYSLSNPGQALLLLFHAHLYWKSDPSRSFHRESLKTEPGYTPDTWRPSSGAYESLEVIQKFFLRDFRNLLDYISTF